MIDFLEVDVLAFRCGYVKQWCYHKLKSLPLNEVQIQRLRQLTLAYCQYTGQRGELRNLARLMIKRADRPLIQAIQDLLEHQNPYTSRKASRVLRIICNGRPDLRGRGTLNEGKTDQ